MTSILSQITGSSIFSYKPLKKIKTVNSRSSIKKTKSQAKKSPQTNKNIQAHRKLSSMMLKDIVNSLTDQKGKSNKVRQSHSRTNGSMFSICMPLMASYAESCRSKKKLKDSCKIEKTQTADNLRFFFKKKDVIKVDISKNTKLNLKRAKSPKIISKTQLSKLGKLFNSRNSTTTAGHPAIDTPQTPAAMTQPLTDSAGVPIDMQAVSQSKAVMQSTCDVNYSDSSKCVSARLIEDHLRCPDREYFRSESSAENFQYYRDQHMPNTKYTEASYIANMSALNVDSPSASLLNGRNFIFEDIDH